MSRLYCTANGFALVLRLLGLFAFTLIAPGDGAWANAPPPSGSTATDATLTVCISTPVASFDPTEHRSRATQLVLENIFEALTVRDANLNPTPRLAESWRAIDPCTWEFKLREGVKFHNGDTLTAYDVKFTFDRIILPNGIDGRPSPRAELFDLIACVNVIDDYTVQIVTKKPWAMLLTMLSLQPIMPRKYFYEVGPEEFRKMPVGTGPFRLQSVGPDGRIVLTRFEDYSGPPGFAAEEGCLPVQRVIFDAVPTKLEQIARLKRGQADLVSDVPAAAVEILKNTPGLAVESRHPTRCSFTEINCAKPAFSDRRIRQALNYAVNASAVVDQAAAGYGIVLPTILMPHAFAYNQDLKPYPYDPTKAAALLREAGYPAGRTVSIQCRDEDRVVGNIIALFLTKIGLRVNVAIDPATRPASVGADAGWDLLVGSWGNTTLDPIDILPPKFKSNGRGNYSGYSNAEVDRLTEEAERSEDMRRRAAAYKEAQAIIYRDAPMIFGYAFDEIYGLRKRVVHFNPSPTGFFRFDDVCLNNGG